MPDLSRFLRRRGSPRAGRLSVREKGDVLTVEFTVLGIPCLGLNGGPEFKHNEAFSFQVATADQAETDRYWNAIVGNGGEESACGWCKDKWGLSWQITPIALTRAITDPDPRSREARVRRDDGDDEDRHCGDRGGAPRLRARSSKMEQRKGIEVLFIAGFGPVVKDVATARQLYGKVLGIAFKEETGGYLHTESLPGAKSFALWPLSEAAQSCFGAPSWPDDIPVPQAWLEFDVEDVEGATAALEAQGHQMLVKNRKEPWGQTVSRFLDPDGLLIGVTFTPFLRAVK